MADYFTFVYYNGRKFEGPEGVKFDGVKKGIKIKRGITYDVLKRKIHKKLRLQSNQIISIITYRMLVRSNQREFFTELQITDSEDIETMIGACDQSSSSYIELYVDIDTAGGSRVGEHQSEMFRQPSVAYQESQAAEVSKFGSHICMFLGLFYY